MSAPLPFPWDSFLQLQKETDSRAVNAFSLAREEALNDLLDALATDTLLAAPEVIRQRYMIMIGNRAKKYRRRQRLGNHLAYHHHLRRPADQFELLSQRELARLVTNGLDKKDRDLLVSLASDSVKYSEIAVLQRRPVGTVKAHVSRLRGQIRRKLRDAFTFRYQHS